MLKLQYFGHLMWRADSVKPWCWERLKAKGEEGSRGWDGLGSNTDSMDVDLSKLWEIVEARGAWSAAVPYPFNKTPVGFTFLICRMEVAMATFWLLYSDDLRINHILKSAHNSLAFFFFFKDNLGLYR